MASPSREIDKKVRQVREDFEKNSLQARQLLQEQAQRRDLESLLGSVISGVETETPDGSVTEGFKWHAGDKHFAHNKGV